MERKIIVLKYGEFTITATVTIEEPMLRFWNNKHEFVSEPGLFEISTGYAEYLILTKELKLL